MKPRMTRPGAAKSLMIAVVIMFLMEHLMFGGITPAPPEQQKSAVETTVPIVTSPPEPEPVIAAEPAAPEPEKPVELPAWKKFAVPIAVPPGMPTVTIIIDDMGVNRMQTKAITALPGPLTTAFLPYPPKIAEEVESARAAGHEIMVHMPMEAEEVDLDTGDYVLRASMIPGTFETVLEDNLSKFGGYVGINNHMGSRLTQNAEAMRIVMAHLFHKGLLFVDSRTIGKSVAAETAAEYGVPHAARDVFLDNEPDVPSVMKNLEKLEALARKHGRAIAIGHPKAGTVEALREWLPTLKEKG
ncbi:MAG TPA: divergent polysaccharide deacetylase family protein, partial [Alphaproteobacteria bacterium]